MTKQQYELISNRYDKRLASIQTVIAFYTVFITTLLLILCDGLKFYELLYFHNVIDNYQDYAGRIVVCFVISFLGVSDNIFTILSVISQRKSCFELREKLLAYEVKKGIYKIHESEEIVTPIKFTILSFFLSLFLFVVIFVYLLILMLSQLYI